MSIGRTCLLRTAGAGLQRGVRPQKSRFLTNSAVLQAPLDVSTLLATPSWSVSSLLPEDGSAPAPSVTSKQLHRLLRLSALPPPKDVADEEAMLATLSSQLHFVRQIQGVDTTGVEPLRSLRDETAEGEHEAELGLDALKEALAKEEVKGKFHKRIKKQAETDRKGGEWDVLGSASKKVGRYFVVEGGKNR